MKTLKELVPVRELCEQIPPGKFDDTVLIYYGHPLVESTIEIIPRSDLGPDWKNYLKKGIRIAYPAPTFTEIISEFAKMELCPQMNAIFTQKGQIIYEILIKDKIIQAEDFVAIDEMLKLWLKFIRKGAKK